jgi:hypothetical protein
MGVGGGLRCRYPKEYLTGLQWRMDGRQNASGRIRNGLGQGRETIRPERGIHAVEC